jgi:proteic killer suppression protein
MNIVFKNAKLEKVFNSEVELRKNYGNANGQTIMRRMSVLSAAQSLADISALPPERRHELTGARKGEFAIDLKHPFRLVIKPNHNPLPRKEDGGIDLKKVTDIIILDVEDYH